MALIAWTARQIGRRRKHRLMLWRLGDEYECQVRRSYVEPPL